MSLPPEVQARVDAEAAAFRAQSARVPGHPEWTIGDLHEAFSRVQDDKHWKNPINKVVRVQSYDEVTMIEEAVAFIAGCRCVTVKVGENAYQIKAAGYYNTIGA